MSCSFGHTHSNELLVRFVQTSLTGHGLLLFKSTLGMHAGFFSAISDCFDAMAAANDDSIFESSFVSLSNSALMRDFDSAY